MSKQGANIVYYLFASTGRLAKLEESLKVIESAKDCSVDSSS